LKLGGSRDVSGAGVVFDSGPTPEHLLSEDDEAVIQQLVEARPEIYPDINGLLC
jgi:hypothetical protein